MLRSLVFILSCIWALPIVAQNDIRPFKSHNQSPLIHFFGLPNSESGLLIKNNSFFISSTLSIASNSTNAKTPSELVYFDGEMKRLEMNIRYGLGKRFELGLSLPLIRHSTGFMDSSIDDFHNALGLTGGARAKIPRDEILYTYIKNGESYFFKNSNSFGFGDISLQLGYQLWKGVKHSLALRGNLKVNTGNKQKLIGSGTVDWSVQLAGQTKGVGKRPAYFFYNLGYLRVGKGAILESLQLNDILFGSLGLAVRSNSWLVPKFQLDYHSKFYKNSETQELGDFGMQFLMGADFLLGSKLILTGGFAEDIKINTSPDFVLHFGASYTF